jgi:hypothetical protein
MAEKKTTTDDDREPKTETEAVDPGPAEPVYAREITMSAAEQEALRLKLRRAYH